MHPIVRCCLALGLAAVCMAASPSGEPDPAVILSVKASPDASLESRFVIEDRREVARLLAGASVRPNGAAPATDVYVTVREGGKLRRYEADASGQLFDPASGGRLVLRPQSRRALLAHIRRLRAVHYGELLRWEQAENVLPRYSTFRVVDLETGLSFRVQRRAGERHADVQPLTKADTKIMKRVYDGTWSWKRRAIVVETEGRRLAASMHGMPHGGDGIPNNGFSGHFCIHFPESSTHGNRRVDFEHQLMVYKAGGRLAEHVNGLSPHEIVNAFFVALKLKDEALLMSLFPNARPAPLAEWLPRGRPAAAKLRPVAPAKPVDAADLFVADIPIDVKSIRSSRSEKQLFVFRLGRLSPAAPWKIDEIAIGYSEKPKKPRVN